MIENIETSAPSLVEASSSSADPIFEAEQKHLREVWDKLIKLRDELTAELEQSHAHATRDVREMSEEIRLDFGGADETLETLASIEALNSIIDVYNQYHDFNAEKLKRLLVLILQPYFAKVSLEMRPGRPPRDVYIGTAGMVDERSIPFIVDWRSPIAQTYYNQEMGPTSYVVDGKERKVNLVLRRQFDVLQHTLKAYFDTTIAIEDSLLLKALSTQRSEKLRDITASIQREQNLIIRHEDVEALLVEGIAGSGKTSVMMQRIAYLFYHNRETLSADQVCIFSPNTVFKHYIDTVLPSLGEANPTILTWREFCETMGCGQRSLGYETTLEDLEAFDQALSDLKLYPQDFKDITCEGTTLIKTSSILAAVEKFLHFGIGPKWCTLVKQELKTKLQRRLTQLSKQDELREELLDLDVDEQSELFGEVVHFDNDEIIDTYAQRLVEHRYQAAYDAIDSLSWMKIDRIGMRMNGKTSLTAVEWLYVRILCVGSDISGMRYVMIDEVQDYTPAQLLVLGLIYKRAHLLMLGDPQQAIYERVSSFERMDEVCARLGKPLHRCNLNTSYRSSPEITKAFSAFLPHDRTICAHSVQRQGTAVLRNCIEDTDAYLEAIHDWATQEHTGLAAIIVPSHPRALWISRTLSVPHTLLDAHTQLPREGIVICELKHAKGLEFDHILVEGVQPEYYQDNPLDRRKLYTAISRGIHSATLIAQGTPSPLWTYLD